MKLKLVFGRSKSMLQPQAWIKQPDNCAIIYNYGVALPKVVVLPQQECFFAVNISGYYFGIERIALQVSIA